MACGHVIRLLAKLREPYYKGVATMAIKLRVISDHYRELGENRTRVFGVNGGTIGRAPDNDWVLPDPKRIVSGHHFEIEYRNGAYWLRDTSTNGVYVNEAEEPVGAGGSVELQDGDRLRVGDYELIVSVDARIDFLPAAHEEHSAAKHLDDHIGAELDVESLFTSRDADSSGSLPSGRRPGQRDRNRAWPARQQAGRPARRRVTRPRPQAGIRRQRRTGRSAPAPSRARNSPTPWLDVRAGSRHDSSHSPSITRRAHGATCARPSRPSAGEPASTRRCCPPKHSPCCR
jgi:type VI secretion system FHA domain protein